MVTVAITQNFAIEQANGEALAHLDLEAIIRSKRVAVKPNDTWASAEGHDRRDSTGHPARGVTLCATVRATRTGRHWRGGCG
jgi:hypothetical protein